MTHVLRFDDEAAKQHGRVGGKGANLAKLTQAGFDVPPGLTVTTDAYTEFVAANHLDEIIASGLSTISWSDSDELERALEDVRSLIVSAPVPDGVVMAVESAYAELGGDEPYVAVRSSGTAEDLAESSFAGLHDSFLDIKGREAVLDAVKRCWASLWTARATAYRHDNGFDQSTVAIAVVIQAMVVSDVSGVMFTANPLTTATDEIVINASWGLGEAVVQGIVTPDEYTVRHRNGRVISHAIGEKSVRIVRDPAAASGTVTESVPEELKDVRSLSDDEIAQLADLGRRIEAYYGGLPQDIEWAFHDGSLYLLQSRPITGVAFSWDSDVDDTMFPLGMDDAEDTIWTRAFSDTVNTGAVTPLTFSCRFIHINTDGWGQAARIAGLDKLARTRLFKYHKGTFYYNTRWERQMIEKIGLPALRPMLLEWTAPNEREDILAAPFSYSDFLRFYLKVTVFERDKSPFTLPQRLETHWRTERAAEIAGLSADKLRGLSDSELIRYTERMLSLELEYNYEFDVGFYIYFRDTMGLLGLLLQHWYDGSDPRMVFGQLIAGSSVQTDTLKENLALWKFSEQIRGSEVLMQTFQQHEGADFFTTLETSQEGRDFLAAYRPWAEEYGHRGEADRDMIYPRRCEDPSLDYASFATFLNSSGLDPEKAEADTNSRRQAVYEEVLANIRRKPLGALKAEAFKILYDLMHKWIVARDNERQSPTDLIMMGFKRGFVEIGRRVHERGLLDEPDGFHYLSKHELYGVFNGHAVNRALVNTKIAARKRNCDRLLHGDVELPKFIHLGRAVDLEAGAAADDDGRLRGTGNSPGVVTGTARVVPKLADMVTVQPGDILIAHATDPGWTPVFLLIKGVVTETGGLLSHASCIAREYGFPAVQMPKAMQLIPNGATITVNGNTGEISIVDEDEEDGDGTASYAESTSTVDARVPLGS
jgi:pyruvate,water dikinase